VKASLAHVLAATGDRRRARELLDELAAEGRGRYVAPFYAAVIHAALDEREPALQALETAHAERSGWMVFLGVEPFFDDLRGEARFRTLMQKVGLPFPSPSPRPE
jgi:hypothetical protein